MSLAPAFQKDQHTRTRFVRAFTTCGNLPVIPAIPSHADAQEARRWQALLAASPLANQSHARHLNRNCRPTRPRSAVEGLLTRWVHPGIGCDEAHQLLTYWSAAQEPPYQRGDNLHGAGG